MGLFKKIKKSFTSGPVSMFRFGRDVAKGDFRAALSRPFQAVTPDPLGRLIAGRINPPESDKPEVRRLEQERIAAAAESADRDARVRRSRLALRSGTIGTSTLGAPLAGVALTRPRLGGG